MMKIYLTDGEDLKGVKHPREITYVRVVRFGLMIIGAWPFAHIGEKKPNGYFVYQIIMVMYCAITPSLKYLYLYLNTNLDFLRMGHIYITAFITTVCITRYPLSIIGRYKELAHRFFYEFHLLHHKDKSDYAMEMHMKVHKISHFFTMYLTTIMIMGMFLYNMSPLYNNVTNGAFEAGSNVSFELSVYVTTPLNPETGPLNDYIIIHIYGWIMSMVSSLFFCAHDLYLSLMVFNVWGHLKILRHSLVTFPMPKNKAGLEDGEVIRFSDQEMEEVFERLKQQIKHYYFIFDYVTKMSDTYGPMLFFYYAFHQASGCLLLLECAEMDPKALTRYGPLTIILFQQLMQLSIIFELIGSESEKLPNAVYGVPWQCMDNRNRKLVLVFLQNVQPAIRLKALGICDVGVRTMASVLKTSASFFTFLQSST